MIPQEWPHGDGAEGSYVAFATRAFKERQPAQRQDDVELDRMIAEIGTFPLKDERTNRVARLQDRFRAWKTSAGKGRNPSGARPGDLF